jgi:hypothetical protein
MLTAERKTPAATPALGISATVTAIACCIGLSAVGPPTAGAVLGLGLGALTIGALALTAAAIITRRRHFARRSLGSERR